MSGERNGGEKMKKVNQLRDFVFYLAVSLRKD